MTLGQRIKTARERLRPKMTQPALAAVLGVTYQAVSEWERGDAKPEVDKIPMLRFKLRVTYAWLHTGQDAPPDPNAPAVLLDDVMGPAAEAEHEDVG